jgi:hypothetical protein
MFGFTDGLSKEDFNIKLRSMIKLITIESKLPYNIFFEYNERINNRLNNFPRLFISINSVYKNILPISIDKDNPIILIGINNEIPEIDKIFNWIKDNYEILMKYWNQSVISYDLLKELVKKENKRHWQQFETDFDYTSLIMNDLNSNIDFSRDDLNFRDGLSDEDFEEQFSYMNFITTRNTNLPYTIIIDTLGKYRPRLNNSPRLFIKLDKHLLNGVLPVSIDKNNPKILINTKVLDFELIARWIKLNYSALMNHWNKKISDCDIFDYLIKL